MSMNTNSLQRVACATALAIALIAALGMTLHVSCLMLTRAPIVDLRL